MRRMAFRLRPLLFCSTRRLPSHLRRRQDNLLLWPPRPSFYRHLRCNPATATPSGSIDEAMRQDADPHAQVYADRWHRGNEQQLQQLCHCQQQQQGQRWYLATAAIAVVVDSFIVDAVYCVHRGQRPLNGIDRVAESNHGCRVNQGDSTKCITGRHTYSIHRPLVGQMSWRPLDLH